MFNPSKNMTDDYLYINNMETIQLITKEMEFREQSKYFFEQNSEKFTEDYRIVSIIGSQSSGKSTLLNALYGTSFSVMNAENQRQQTTKGIWITSIPEEDLFVLDIEGSDSRERWQEKNTIEKKLSVFGIMISNLLIVNIWLNEIGRFSAASYEIIKFIMETHLQYFKNQSPKKLLFVIRDFSDEENFLDLRNLLKYDVQKLWDEIIKPEKFANSDLEDFLEIDAFAIRHYLHQPNEFQSDVQTLRNRLKVLAKNTSSEDIKSRNVPVDGLHHLMGSVWKMISLNNDINIPNETKVTSFFRCRQIKTEIAAKVKQEVMNIFTIIPKTKDFSLSKFYNKHLASSKALYDKKTSHYDPAIATESKVELVKQINSIFHTLFDAENKRISKELIQKIFDRLEKITQGQFQLKKLIESFDTRKKAAAKMYASFIEEFDYEQSFKEEKKRLFNLQLTKGLNTFISGSAGNVTSRWRRNILAELMGPIRLTFQNLHSKSWKKFNETLNAKVNEFREQMREVMNASLEGKILFNDETIRNQEILLINSVKKDLKNFKGIIGESMNSAFKYIFEHSKDGSKHNWMNYKDEDIERLFIRTKSKFSKNLNFLSSSFSLDFEDIPIFSKEEAQGMRNSFEIHSNQLLQKAYDLRYDQNVFQRVPLIAWMMLIYFTHTKIIIWIKKDWFLIFTILGLVCLLFILFSKYTEKISHFWNDFTMKVSSLFERVFYRIPSEKDAKEAAKLWNSSAGSVRTDGSLMGWNQR